MKKRTLTTLLVLTTLVLVCITTLNAQAQFQDIRYASFYDEYIERLGSSFSTIKNISYRYTFVSDEGNKTCISFGVFLDYGKMETPVDTAYTAFFFGNRFNNECAQFARKGTIYANLQVLGKEDEPFAKDINDAYFNGTDQELLEAFDRFVQHITKSSISFLPEPTETPTPSSTPTVTATATATSTSTLQPTDTATPLPTPTVRPTATQKAPAQPAIVLPIDPPDQDQPQAAQAPSLSQEAILGFFGLGIFLLLGIGVAIVLLSPPKKGGGASHA